MQANVNGASASSSSSLVCYCRPDGSAFEMHNVQTGPGTHPDSCVYRRSLPKVKQTGRGADHPSPSSAEVKNERSYTSTSLCAPEVCYRETIRLNLFIIIINHLRAGVFTIMYLKQTTYPMPNALYLYIRTLCSSVQCTIWLSSGSSLISYFPGMLPPILIVSLLFLYSTCSLLLVQCLCILASPQLLSQSYFCPLELKCTYLLHYHG